MTSIDVTNYDGETPLFCACYASQPQGDYVGVVRLLLDLGADPHIQNNMGETALHRAIRSDKPDLVRILLDHGADPAIQTNEGENSLDYARKYASEEITRMLLVRYQSCE